MKSVLYRALTHQQIVDLFHSAPMFNPRASAYLLAALSRRFEYGDVCLAVVDPGVGDPDRRAIVIEADGISYVGPDNGLFSIIVKQATKVHCMEVTWRPTELSTSFHGRDLFAPIVVKMALRERLESTDIANESLVGADWGTSLSEIIYLDHYGNAVSGIWQKQVNPDCVIQAADMHIRYQQRFSSVPVNQPFWYINSMGLVEIAVNQGSAARQLGLSIGAPVAVSQ